METKALLCKFCGQDHTLPLEKFCDMSDLEIKYDILQKRIEELTLALADRSEKYKLFIDKGLDKLHRENKELQKRIDELEAETIRVSREFIKVLLENKKLRSLLLDVSVELKEVGESFEIAVRQALGEVEE